jgi:predicted metal-dependent peptidase
MAITAADILSVVKARLQLSDGSLDSLINSYIPEIENRILHYCNVDVVPDGLKFVWSSMVVDVLRVEHPTVAGIEETVGAGEKMQIGDTSVSADKGPGLNNMSKSVIDEVVLNYRIDLNRYRKLRW